MAVRFCWLLISSVVALFIGGAACDRVDVFETRLSFDNNGTRCGAELEGKALPMDTVIVLVDEAISPTCRQCTSGSCPQVATRCHCGPPRSVSLEDLAAMAEGMRFAGMDAQKSYCFTVAAIEARHGVKGSGPCDCDPRWLEAGRFASWGRVCGGARGSIDPEGVELSVNCLDNGRDIDISECLGP